MRSKEEAKDYPYFPDPDLLPVIIEDELIERLRSELPELPETKKNPFVNEYGLSPKPWRAQLTATRETGDYLEQASPLQPNVSPKKMPTLFNVN
ncbi:MAG: hypothetical protein CM1200mP36_05050 [Gammaproteobacteria bacterium]|nr:MAG: hypothetical protein CM1200mP36_05050 [Gammaproteobacteria bacterium]